MSPWRAFLREPDQRMALVALLVHDTLIGLIVLATTFLAWSHDVNDSTITAIFSAALGYAGGAAASRSGQRSAQIRRTDQVMTATTTTPAPEAPDRT